MGRLHHDQLPCSTWAHRLSVRPPNRTTERKVSSRALTLTPLTIPVAPKPASILAPVRHGRTAPSIAQAMAGSNFSGSSARSLMALGSVFLSNCPSCDNASKVAYTVCSASISKCRRRAARVSLRVAAGLLFVAAVQYAFMSSIDHVLASHSARYTLMALFFWQAALVSFSVIQVGAVLPAIVASRRLHLALTAAMVLAVAVTHGWPSRGVVRAAIDRSCGRYTDDVLAAGCTHLAGDYWRVWTTMFHANLRLADQQAPRRVWGISHRCEPTAKYWRQIPKSEMRIGEIVGDEAQSAAFRQWYRAPTVVAREQVGAVRVLCPIDVAPGSVASSASSSDKKMRNDPRLGDALVVRPR
jgi:hypothetical protein